MKSKTEKIQLDYGSYLGVRDGCLFVRDKQKNVQKIPMIENRTGELQVGAGSSVSSTALSACAAWDIPVLIKSSRGKPVAYLRSIDDDANVHTRICQYQALENGKGAEIAKRVVYAKAQAEFELLKKYGLRQLDLPNIKKQIDGIDSPDIKQVRKGLLTIEGHFSSAYFKEVWQVLPKIVRSAADQRMTYQAYDRCNNLFNLGFYFLKWRVYNAVVRAKMEPFAGFLHSEQAGKCSLVLDLMELYRSNCDDFMLQFTKKLSKKDFEVKGDNKKGKREYLKKDLADQMMVELNQFFERKVAVCRINLGTGSQELESLIVEEAQSLAKYLRNEKPSWNPRIPTLT